MASCSSLPLGPGLSHELDNSPVPGAKRALQSPDGAQPEESTKKRCQLNHYCNTPCPLEKLLLSSPDSACFLASSHCLDDAEAESLVNRSSLMEDSAVVLSLDTTRCFDDSMLDDSLLEPTDSEQEDSSCSYTEEEIQQILADDDLEPEPYTSGKFAVVNLNVGGENMETIKSRWTWESGAPKDAKTLRTKEEVLSDVSPSWTCSSASSRCSGLDKETASPNCEKYLSADCLKMSQITGTLFDSGMEELPSVTLIDAVSPPQMKGGDVLEETEKAAVPVIRNHVQNADKSSTEDNEICCNSLALEEAPELPAQHSLDANSLENPPVEIQESFGCCSAPMGTSTHSPDLVCDQNKDDVDDSAPGLLQHLKAFSSASNPDPPKSTEGGLLENIGSQTEDLGQESSVSELTDNLKLNTVISSQSCGEDTPSGKKLGKVLPVPQMETRLRRRLYTSETELEQRKRIYIRCVQAHVRTPRDTTQGTLEEWYALLSNVASKNGNHDQSWKYTLDLTMRNYPRFSKKPTQKYSLDQWVNKNSANYHRFQSIPDRFQRSPVTGSSNE
ncbi:S100P-binding protein isoform X1 [Alligator mississippiensis]|uniref:S100P-binding protein isoform X1 n=1 Tax=Alligator mississippiensis TaxID=8496 RepID=UPI002877F985|nr:S100P-binding protein isoform X1 [Alligator mississippiensis]